MEPAFPDSLAAFSLIKSILLSEGLSVIVVAEPTFVIPFECTVMIRIMISAILSASKGGGLIAKAPAEAKLSSFLLLIGAFALFDFLELLCLDGVRSAGDFPLSVATIFCPSATSLLISSK